MEILKRSLIIKKLMIFVIFSLYYLYMVRSINIGLGALNQVEILNFLKSDYYLLILFLVTLISIFYAKKSSKYISILFFVYISGNSFYYFLLFNNKIVLTFSILYLIVSYIFYFFLKEELETSVFAPKYYENQLSKKQIYDLKVAVQSGKNYREGFLTNCDTSGCFIYFGDELKAFFKKNTDVSLVFYYLGCEFFATGELITKFGGGYGVSIKEKLSPGDKLGWRDFYSIIRERGYFYEL